MSTLPPRVPPLPEDAGISEETTRIFAGARELLAFVSSFARTAAHVPALARWMIPMIAAIQRGGPDAELDPRIKELAILKTSTLNACFF